MIDWCSLMKQVLSRMLCRAPSGEFDESCNTIAKTNRHSDQESTNIEMPEQRNICAMQRMRTPHSTMHMRLVGHDYVKCQL
jgi:hypothetical protein